MYSLCIINILYMIRGVSRFGWGGGGALEIHNCDVHQRCELLVGGRGKSTIIVFGNILVHLF